jgi:hypothetical protein
MLFELEPEPLAPRGLLPDERMSPGPASHRPEPDFLGIFHTQAIPPKIIARISTAPQLPVINVQWYWQSPGYSIVSVNHRAFILYAEHGRNDQSQQLRFTNNNLTSVLNFGGEVMGGALDCYCSVNWRRTSDGATGTTPEGSQFFGILADSPSKPDVRAAVGDLALQVIAYKEARFRQFDNASLPLWGPPNGFGIMQLDTPRPTSRQIWDWRDNIAGGKGLYTHKQSEVQQHYDNEYKKYPKAPKLTPEQLRLALYQYYNGGWYWVWDVTAKKWQGTGVYGDDAMSIQKAVAAGHPPSDW